jgi:hypothetical protein
MNPFARFVALFGAGSRKEEAEAAAWVAPLSLRSLTVQISYRLRLYLAQCNIPCTA